jgi:UMF1 family MFS transporter
MGRFVPERQQAEFFGFFAFSGKATAFMGPLLLGWATATFASQRAGVGTVLVFFAIGGVLLARVDEPAGIAAARAG